MTSGTPPNMSLHLSDEQKAWLVRTFGHVQTGISELIEAAMTGTRPRLERLPVRRVAREKEAKK